MNKKIIFYPFISLGLMLSISGCDNHIDSSSTFSSFSTSTSWEDGDGYVDELPDDMNDGIILQAFDWSFNEVKNNLEHIKYSGFKMVQLSPVTPPKNNGSIWYYFYQPLGFSIANESPLGTKDELIDLCTKAHEFGINILVDVVFNHLATTGELDGDGLPIPDPNISKYEPEIYANLYDCFHHDTNSSNVTQFYSGLPDLNTSHPLVQSRALSLLKECIDCGVDGFRFDAAKHIETPKDRSFPSSFWPNTVGVAKDYYKEKTGNDLFCYGEILNELDGNRKDEEIKNYTEFMKVTDNQYHSQFGGSLNNAEKIVKQDYCKKDIPSNLVLWGESHDDYLHLEGKNPTSNNKFIRKYGILASRKDVNVMFFARAPKANDIGKINDYLFEKDILGAGNRFHNRFVKADEYLSSFDNCVINERVSLNDEGAMISNLDVFTIKEKTVKFTHIKDGIYFDQSTGDKVVVKNSEATISFCPTGVAYLTHSHNRLSPDVEVDTYYGTFPFSKTINLSVKNFTSGFYRLDDSEEVRVYESNTININGVGEHSLKIRVENYELVFERTFTYEIIEIPVSDKFQIINLDSKYITDYELYIWSWPKDGGASSWHKDYSYDEEKQILYMNDVSSYKGFLFAIFVKGHEIKNKNAWDNEVLAQSKDINPSDTYFDASGFNYA